MMRDLASMIVPVTAFGPEVRTTDNTPVSVDLHGFNSAAIVLCVGVGGITFDTTNKIEFKLTHSDDNSTFTNVTDEDMQGVTGITSGIIRAFTAAHAAAANYEFGYVGGKRYLRILADFSGTHGTGTPMAALVIKGNGNYKP